MLFQEFIHNFGSGLCHQLPDRTLGVGANLFPVCARCSGIYIGFAVALVALLIWYRHDHRVRRLSGAFMVAGGLAVALMGWDGISSYAGLRATSNDLRAVTGIAFGASLAVLAYAMLVDTLAAPRPTVSEGTKGSEAPRNHSAAPKPLLGGVASLAWWLGSIAASYVLLVGVLPLSVMGPIGPLAVAAATILTFAAFGTVLVGMVPRFTRSVSGVASLRAPALLGVLAGSAMVAIAKVIQALLDSWVVR